MLSSLFSFKRHIGLGVALASFLVAIMPHFTSQKQENQASLAQNAQGTPGVVSMETAPPQELPPVQVEGEGQMAQVGAQTADDSSAPVPNPIFKELEFSEEGFNWHKDWWKYLALAIGSLLVLYYGLRITRMIFRLAIFLLCVAAGLLGAICLEPTLSPWLSPRMPEALTRYMTSHHLGYAIGFLVCYLLATLVISFIPRKMQGGKAAEKI